MISGTVRVPPEKFETALPHMRRMLEATRAEAGCRFYSFARDVLDPELVHVIEAWDSAEALQRHFETPHMKAWRAAHAEFGLTDRRLMRHEVTSSEPL